ncbi:group 1 truncated hemoglobin [Lutimaribacter marinistellae]|uniref:Group 1 truncated hemoglobin n=1 Tax=Lutimaribacter marinistellae TaxID=1820329 RepID=A0ABV7TGJ9_9RHOB
MRPLFLARLIEHASADRLDWCALGPNTMSGSTFEKYGGFSVVSRIVMTFYDLVLESDVVGPFFDDVDMPRQIDHQTKFVSGIMGGPAPINDARLRAVHAHLSISDPQFDEIISLFVQALDQHGVAPEDAAALAAVMESKRSLIVHER